MIIQLVWKHCWLQDSDNPISPEALLDDLEDDTFFGYAKLIQCSHFKKNLINLVFHLGNTKKIVDAVTRLVNGRDQDSFQTNSSDSSESEKDHSSKEEGVIKSLRR